MPKLIWNLVTAVIFSALLVGGASSQTAKRAYISFDSASAERALKTADLPILDQHALAVFKDGFYVGQLDDYIWVGNWTMDGSISIIGRSDGESWNNAGMKGSAEGFVELFRIATSDLVLPTCLTDAGDLCKDIELRGANDATIVTFRNSAFENRGISVVSLAWGPAPPRGSEVRTIKIETRPSGAEIFFGNGKYWDVTDCDLDVPFGTQREPVQVTLREPKEARTVQINLSYDSSYVRYDFQTGEINLR